MRNYKIIMRSCLLYIMALVVASGYPLTALASTEPPVVSQEAIVQEAAPQEAPTQSSEATPAPTAEAQPTTEVPVTTTPPEATPEVSAPVDEANTQAPAVTPTPVEPETHSGAIVMPLPVATVDEKPQTSSTNTADVTTTVNGVNNLSSHAQTGDSSITTNTTAGSATTGDATAAATIINSVHSTVQGDTAGVAHFTADIHGNVVGDITLAPMLSGVLTDPTSAPLTTTVQADQSTNLTNNISLSALSGDADVSRNTTAGSATTGSANTVANVINLINSIIAANKSFVGTINIYGNLDGDILVSPEFIPQLIASNAPNVAGSSDTLSTLGAADTQAIVNNVNLSAMSGNADVSRNTTAGSATTGTATTNLTILNLTGHEVVASNSLLVFVNVLGQWVGMIVDAPVGATAAAIGNGVTSSANRVVDADTTHSITNNIDLASQSGDATVHSNTLAGNATSGDATASANIANISTSVFSLSDWFGVLFINVFGSWYGSFGVNTANGEVVPLTDGLVPLTNPPLVAPSVEPEATAMPQFGFVPQRAAVSYGSPVPSAGVAEEVPEAPVVKTASAPLDEVPELFVSEEEEPAATTTSDTPRPYAYIALMVLSSLIGAALIANGSLRQK